MVIRNIREDDKQWLTEFTIKAWESTKIVTKGKVYDISDLPGLIVHENENKLGVLTYNINVNECEIITLNVLEHNKGIGTLLLQELIKRAKQNKWTRVWAITTNDNLPALRFYEKSGFAIKAVYPNAMELSRKLKPEIPLVGENGIPIKDEIEVELKIDL